MLLRSPSSRSADILRVCPGKMAQTLHVSLTLGDTGDNHGADNENLLQYAG